MKFSTMHSWQEKESENVKKWKSEKAFKTHVEGALSAVSESEITHAEFSANLYSDLICRDSYPYRGTGRWESNGVTYSA